MLHRDAQRRTEIHRVFFGNLRGHPDGYRGLVTLVRCPLWQNISDAFLSRRFRRITQTFSAPFCEICGRFMGYALLWRVLFCRFMANLICSHSMEENNTAEEFLSRFSAPGENIEIRGFKLEDPILINPDVFDCDSVALYDCVLSSITFQNVEIGTRFSFYNCSFGSLEFRNIFINKIDNIKIVAITIDECVIAHSLLFDECIIENDAEIYKSKIGMLDIRNLKLLGDFYLISTEIDAFVQISRNNISGTIGIVESNCSGIMFFESESNVFKLRNNVFGEGVILGSYTGKIEIEDCIFKNDMYIENAENVYSIDLSKNEFNKTCDIKYGLKENMDKPSKIYISTCTFGEGLLIGKSHNSQAGKFYLDEICISFSDKLKGLVLVRDCIVDSFILKGVNSNASLVVNNVSPRQFIIDNFSNYANVQLLHLQARKDTVDTVFSILNSYLGKFQFFNVDFSSFKSTVVINSFLTEIVSSNVKWFDERNLSTGNTSLGNVVIDKNSDKYEENRYFIFSTFKEIYRQLKVTMEKHGNRTDALMFQQLEMKYYEKQLKYSKRGLTLDRIILWTNNSNDHGQNWIKPILIAIPVTLVFYFLIVLSASNDFTFHVLCADFYLFPQLFNPVRALDKILLTDKHTLTWVTYTLDLFQRILISYFIFQTVSAFRKYTKS